MDDVRYSGENKISINLVTVENKNTGEDEKKEL